MVHEEEGKFRGQATLISRTVTTAVLNTGERHASTVSRIIELHESYRENEPKDDKQDWSGGEVAGERLRGGVGGTKHARGKPAPLALEQC